MRNFITSALALSAISLASAQFTINPNEVSASLRNSWCQGETNSCISLCGGIGTPPLNDSCDSTSLDYNCTCANGSAPGLQYYTNTMPTYICLQAFSDCNTANVGNSLGQANCTTAIFDKCGTLNPNNVTIASPSTSSASHTSSATASSVASGSSSAPTTSSSKAAAPTNVMYVGNGAAAAALGLFAYLL